MASFFQISPTPPSSFRNFAGVRSLASFFQISRTTGSTSEIFAKRTSNKWCCACPRVTCPTD